MKKTVTLIMLLLIATQSGCGSSESSSGAISETWSGSYEATLNGLGGFSSYRAISSGPITLSFSGENIIRDSGQDGASGKITNSSWTIHSSASRFLNIPGCLGTITQRGTLYTGSTSGTFTSSGLSCNGKSFSLTGSFQASL